MGNNPEDKTIDMETVQFFKQRVDKIKDRPPSEILPVSYLNIEKMMRSLNDPKIDKILDEISEKYLSGIWEATVQNYCRVSTERVYAIKYMDRIEFFTTEMFKIILSHFINTLNLIEESEEENAPDNIKRVLDDYASSPLPPGATKV